MKKQKGIGTVLLLLLILPCAAQQKQEPLPRVLSAWAPLYPQIAAAALIQGVVNLRVSTDGKHVVTFDAESGPPFLVQTAKENVKTWEFEQHKPTSFDIRFNYKLSPPPPCETEFDSRDPKNTSVLLQLPISVELNAIITRICDPAVTIEKK